MTTVLTNLLESCTVRILGGGKLAGTGFWVAPGEILTCAHVLRIACQQGLSPVVDFEKVQYPLIGEITTEEPFPDLALIKVEYHDHPCVWLDEAVSVWDDCYSFGYPQKEGQGESTTLQVAGIIDSEQRRIKLTMGQVKPGASGSPLLNRKTGFVCGIVKSTFDQGSAFLGGSAIPVRVLSACLPGLLERSRAFHQMDGRWAEALKRHQAETRPEVLPPLPTITVSADLYTPPQLVTVDGQEPFFGREQWLERIQQSIDNSERILLTGLGGIGKTALAKMAANRWLQTGRSAVLWVNVGTAGTQELMGAVADRVEGIQALANRKGETAGQALRTILDASQVGLVVLDDARSPTNLYGLMEAIPARLAVLVTSRQKFNLKMMDVGQLSPSEALHLLGYHAGEQGLQKDPAAKNLCKLLGYHPLALKICGSVMKIQNRGPAEQLRRLHLNPLLLTQPGGFAPKGHESLKALFEDCIRELNQAEKEVFIAFGAFFSPGLSVDLLVTYLGSDRGQIETALDEMVEYNLVTGLPGASYYSMHDLTFTFARSLYSAEEADHQKAIQAVQVFLAAHAQDFDLLSLEMPNLLGTAGSADDDTLVQIMSLLALGGYPLPGKSSYFNERGSTLAMLEALDQAVQACRQSGDDRQSTLHYLLSKRGNAAFNRGEYASAAQIYQEAGQLAPDQEREVILLAATGCCLAITERDQEAESCFQQAYQLSMELDSDFLYSYVLEKESEAAGYRKNYTAARRIAIEQVKLNERLIQVEKSPENVEALFYSLLNLGSAELDLAKQQNQSFAEALEIHLRAHQIAEELKNPLFTAYVLSGMGEDYHYLGDREKAQTCFLDALSFFRKQEMLAQERNLVQIMSDLAYELPSRQEI